MQTETLILIISVIIQLTVTTYYLYACMKAKKELSVAHLLAAILLGPLALLLLLAISKYRLDEKIVWKVK